ncbi:hypothetical protein NLJ89_g930 [Agrocybe chaxingu]|uniref:Uncharacterized protein n=1 Tax=Agrocybe chaxingu TaxID=84603 RepID=A0A9W8TEB2_9AGAR|nr:hypothetical protein NLJ89_g930 [Agrocybe chaxingu]
MSNTNGDEQGQQKATVATVTSSEDDALKIDATAPAAVDDHGDRSNGNEIAKHVEGVGMAHGANEDTDDEFPI